MAAANRVCVTQQHAHDGTISARREWKHRGQADLSSALHCFPIRYRERSLRSRNSPSPTGTFKIINHIANPTWYYKGKVVGPGPGNPVGTRWMGLSAPGVGIHGTPDDASIGYSASHGCIRMHIPDAEWLFHHVDIGTPVVITDA